MVLPSLRLACCWMLGRKLAVLPLRVEGLATYKAKANSENHDDHLVVYYHKNVSIYRLQELGLTVESGEKVATPFYSTVFNKKIECMTFNDKGTAIASDKFGDIYALDGQTVPRYLNSNLGIPTFL